MGKFVSIPIEVDPEAVALAAKDEIAAEIPGWVAPTGSFEDRLLRAGSRLAGDLTELAADVPGEIVFEIGQSLLQITPQAAVSASVASTWTMVDDQGYTIPADTEVGIPVTGDQLVAFTVATEVAVPPGETTTETGEVLLVAKEPGAANNGLTGTPRLLSALTFVDPDLIVLAAATADGVDAETVDQYLDNFTDETSTLSPTPIHPEDFAKLARRVPTVYRALAVDNYNPDDETTDNERMVAIAAIKEDGSDVSPATNTAITALLESMRESTFLAPTFAPTRTAIDVVYEAKALPGYDTTVVKAAIDSALANYLNDAVWGRYPIDADPKIWRRITVVRHSEIVALINSVPGVDYIDSEDLEIAEGGGTPAAANVALDGQAPLATLGDVTGTVT